MKMGKGSSPKFNRGGLKGDLKKVMKKDEKAVEKTTMIRRINKMLLMEKGIPKAASFTSKTIPPELLEKAEEYYTKAKKHLKRGDDNLEKDAIYKRVVKELALKHRKGKCIKEMKRVDHAANVFIEFSDTQNKKGVTSGEQWDTQSNEMRKKIRASDGFSVKNVVRNLATEVGEMFGKDDCPTRFDDVVKEAMAKIMEDCLTLDDFLSWWDVAGYNIASMKEAIWKLKEAKEDCDAMKDLVDKKGKNASSVPNAQPMQHFWFAAIPKMKKAMTGLKLTRSVRCLLVKKNILKVTKVGSTYKYTLVLDEVGALASAAAAATTPGRKKRESLTGKVGDAKGLEKTDEWKKTIEELEYAINQDANAQMVMRAMFKCIFPDIELMDILERPIEELYWMKQFPKLEAGGLMGTCYKELEKGAAQFLPLYWCYKMKCFSVQAVFGETVLKEAGKAQLAHFFHDIRTGNLMKWEQDMALTYAKGKEGFYCNKLLDLCDALQHIIGCSDYDSLAEKKEHIASAGKQLKQDGADPTVMSALEGYLRTKLVRFHEEDIVNLKEFVAADKLSEASRLFDQKNVIENRIQASLNVTDVWEAFWMTAEGKELKNYRTQNGLDLNTDDDTDEFTDAEEGSEEDEDGEEGEEDSEEEDDEQEENSESGPKGQPLESESGSIPRVPEDINDALYGSEKESDGTFDRRLQRESEEYFANTKSAMKRAAEAAAAGAAMKKSSPKNLQSKSTTAEGSAEKKAAAAAGPAAGGKMKKASPASANSMKTAASFKIVMKKAGSPKLSNPNEQVGGATSSKAKNFDFEEEHFPRELQESMKKMGMKKMKVMVDETVDDQLTASQVEAYEAIDQMSLSGSASDAGATEKLKSSSMKKGMKKSMAMKNMKMSMAMKAAAANTSDSKSVKKSSSGMKKMAMRMMMKTMKAAVADDDVDDDGDVVMGDASADAP